MKKDKKSGKEKKEGKREWKAHCGEQDYCYWGEKLTKEARLQGKKFILKCFGNFLVAEERTRKKKQIDASSICRDTECICCVETKKRYQ